MMNHPTREDWMTFLYEENSPERRAELDAHLRTCAECAAEVSAWRAGAKALDGWALPAASGSTRRRRPAWAWAAAAALVLGAGVALGRFTVPAAPDAGAWRASLTQDIDHRLAAARSELAADFRQQQSETLTRLSAALDSAGAETQRLLAEYSREQETLRLEDKETLVTTLRRFDLQYATSLAALRKELETVAVNTEDSFAETEQRLGQIAAFAQPSTPEPR